MNSTILRTAILAVLCSAIHLTTALPITQGLSELLARDEAYEPMLLERRGSAASPCSLLDLDDLEALPGWPALQAYAHETWGEGDWKIEINPPGYRDKPATMCVADPVKVDINGDIVCNETRVDIAPKKGSNTIIVDAGYTNVGNWNITNVTSVAHANFFMAWLQMPNITLPTPGHLTLKPILGTGSFINAPHNSFVTKATNRTEKRTSLTVVTDKRCIGTINHAQCLISAKGRIQLLATGYIWFNYETKRAPLANPTGVKHHRYTVKIEDVLKNATDRAAYIDFSGNMNATMRSDYFDECRWNFRL